MCLWRRHQVQRQIADLAHAAYQDHAVGHAAGQIFAVIPDVRFASLRLSGTTLEFAALTASAQFRAIELFLDPMKRIVADDFSVTQAEN